MGMSETLGSKATDAGGNNGGKNVASLLYHQVISL